MEKVYKTTHSTGIGYITIGIITIVTGFTVEIVSIVSGAPLLRRKSEIESWQAGLIMIGDAAKRQKLGWTLFISYLCLLTYFTFLLEPFERTDTDRGYQYSLVPSKEIAWYFRYYDVLGPISFMISIIKNAAVFMSFGFFLPVISRHSKKWYNTVIFGFVLSPILETLQLVFKVGSFDVDDMLLNTLGTAAGYLCYRLIQWTRCKLRKRRFSR